MERIFKDFDNFINENMYSKSAAYGLAPLSSNFSSGSSEPYDPNLSFDPLKNRQNTIQDQIQRATNILKTIPLSSYTNKKDDFNYNVEEFTIIRMYKNNNMLLDIYFKFYYNDEQFYGYIKNFGGIVENIFSSTILGLIEFNTNAYKYKRLKNMIINTLNKWFKPIEDSEYRLLEDIELKNDLGIMCTLNVGSFVKVKFVSSTDKPYIIITYNNIDYRIEKLEYYYFNWKFKLTEKTTFYL